MKFWGKGVRKSKKDRPLKNNYIKLVYFDEVSTEDYLKVKFGGKRSHEVSDTGKTSTDIDAGSELSGQAGGKTKATGGLLIGSGFAAKVQRLTSRQKNTLLRNTPLTDYLNSSLKDSDISIFTDYVVAPYSQSLTHLKMIAPYVSIIDGKIPVDGANDMFLDLKSFDKSLSGAIGYFEMIASKRDERNIVLRFNSEAFYNNYSLYDITKMNLVFHAIRVGTSREIDLSFTNEINKITGMGEEKISIPDDGFTDSNQKAESDSDQLISQPNDLDVYDVVFAGVTVKR